MILRNFVFIIILGLINIALIAQDNEINPNGYNRFYYENGKLASEGNMRNGKPDGYWKTYYETGTLKSEGNRKNFELDSVWKFYDEERQLKLEINYKNGKKNGIQKTYRNTELVEENFVDDIKQGFTKYYYPDKLIKKTILFKDGLEIGLAKEYSKDGIVITILEYRKGFIINRQYINRKDNNGLKQGIWKEFHNNGLVSSEGRYRNNKKHGYFKYYDINGNLLSVEKYLNDELQKEVEEIKNLEERIDYYSDGNIKTIGHYYNNRPDGIRREYSKEGEVIQSFVFKEGRILGKGIMDEQGKKQKYWKEYYENGTLKAEGKYKNGIRIGPWKFYHINGNLEQEGSYNSIGNFEGIWKWYYLSGNLLREESYLNGILDGLLTEYIDNDTSIIIIQGEYIEGFENGKWYYDLGDFKEEGSYVDGMRDGSWKGYFSNGNKSYEAKFIEDNPNGKYVQYWDNGRMKDEGTYVMGKRIGEWRKYDNDGTLFLTIYYKDGIEKKYDGVKIKPEIESDDL